MAIADRAGLPVAITIASASPHETRLVEQTLNASFLPENPSRLVGDAAYDSDGLDRTLAAVDIELIAPHRGNRLNLTQDGRPLRRYRRRVFLVRRTCVHVRWMGSAPTGCGKPNAPDN